MLTDRGVKILYQKKKRKILKLHEMSRKVVSIVRLDGQTDRQTDRQTDIQYMYLCGTLNP